MTEKSKDYFEGAHDGKIDAKTRLSVFFSRLVNMSDEAFDEWMPKPLIQDIPERIKCYCKDCAWRDAWGDCEALGEGGNRDHYYHVEDYHYCGYAERK